jgi:uroporphyrinogen III methyltransferase/synthase
MQKGMVYLVGAGPGRADLITVRGAELIRRADCVICDKLANAALAGLARSEAEIFYVPKRIGAGSFTQEQINELLVGRASEGKVVVRLKGGDPCMFGRCSEEMAALAEAGIDFEIVPGVTAGIAAGEYAGMMLTDRRYSSQVTFITGREAEEKTESHIDWGWLAKSPGTLVFYMAMGTLETIAAELTAHGMSEETAAAAVSDATLPSQQVAKGRLCDISDVCKAKGVGAPAIVVVGAAAEGDSRFDWLRRRVLFGRGIVATRDAAGNVELAAKIVERGGLAIEFATIAILPRTDSSEFLQMLSRFGEYEWVVFTSVNGVRIFFDALAGMGKDARVFGAAKVAAIGERTAGQLAEYGVRTDFVPAEFTGAKLAVGLAGHANLRGKKVLLLRSDAASKEAVEILEKAGALVEEAAIYETVTVCADAGRLEEEIARGAVEWVTFASPSAVRGFFEQVSAEVLRRGKVKTASIGPVTSEALRGMGVEADVEASEHTIDGLLDAIEGTYR